MATITPMLDTMLPQVFGRLGDLERFSATRVNNPLTAITAITGGDDSAGRSQMLRRPLSAAQPGLSSARGQSVAAAATKTFGSGAHTAAGPGPSTADVASQGGHISRAGTALAALFQRFPAAPKSAATRPGPLMSGQNSPQPSALAALLGEQVSHSGVFYEAHLLQWFEGRRTLAQMRAESANRLISRDFDTTAAAPNRDGDAKAPVDDRLLPIVRQQFDALQHGIFRWQGHAWPGVPMQWQIESRPDRGHSSDGSETEPSNAATDAPAEHATSLRLEMPRLGTLEIRLTLAANQVHVSAWADDAGSASMLDADVATLRRRLHELGFDAASVNIVKPLP